VESENIAKVLIDDKGRLCVAPESEEFAHIFRSAMEVHWDNQDKCLYSPNPREWSYERWFQQIIAAVRVEYGCALVLTAHTQWDNISSDLKAAILASMAAKA